MQPLELSNNLLILLESLIPLQALKDWIYEGETDVAFSSPTGAWQNAKGFLFKKSNAQSSIILRSVPDSAGASYIVLESVNMRCQLYNIGLNKQRVHTIQDGKSIIRESYNMTVGKKRKQQDVIKVFEELGVKTDYICKIEDEFPLWEDFIVRLLNWGILREKVRAKFQEIIPEPNVYAEKIYTEKSKFPLNQILFGPPGTGKTFNSINRAVAIIENEEVEDIASEERSEVKERFDGYIKTGQIVFTTFHQSMSYEDFIEGIKPETVEGSVTYEIQNGIFKRICLDAQISDIINFDTIYSQFIKDLSNLPEGELLKLQTIGNKEFYVSANSRDNINLYTGINSRKSGAITKEGIQKELRGESYYLWWRGYYQGIMQYLKDKYNFNPDTSVHHSKPNKLNPYVLIIDEINRGNVSQIFGELITLIEDDKRIDKDEALEITLPYSKEKFGVPANLYIIGTMNTADRSVEALDAALRRRFCFEEMPPKAELIGTVGKLKEKKGILEEIDLVELLRIINKRIEKLIDKDHQIGHSYFMSVESLDDLKVAFQNKIIPLLQEYFFGDYGKIGLVLGEGFFEKPENELNTNVFSNFFGYSADELAERPIFRLKDITKLPDDEFISAVLLQMKK